MATKRKIKIKSSDGSFLVVAENNKIRKTTLFDNFNYQGNLIFQEGDVTGILQSNENFIFLDDNIHEYEYRASST